MKKGEKWRKKNRFGPGRKIPNMLLAGVRVIFYYPADVDAAVKLLQSEFAVDDKLSSDTINRLAADQFGYRSVHLICNLNKARKGLSEWKHVADFRVEIQLITVLQHAWAAISHALQYKREAEVPDALKRRLSRLSGLLELADEEFSTINSLHLGIEENLADSSDKYLEKQTINKVSLEEFVKRSSEVANLVRIAQTAGFFIVPFGLKDEYSDLSLMCEISGIFTISQLESLIKTPSEIVQMYFNELKQATGPWNAPPVFILLLLIVGLKIDKFSGEILQEKFGWSPTISKLVHKAAKNINLKGLH